jgi:subtilisin family serine protease
VNDATNAAVASGLNMIVAAGNSNRDACNYSPASAASAVTVGATDITDTRASYSNYGTCLDIFGPGTDITSAWIGSPNATKTISGTSMATPHVAGVAAKYLSADPSLTTADVTAKLIADATKGVVKNADGFNSKSPNLIAYGFCT